jgi:hypothetical protein
LVIYAVQQARVNGTEEVSFFPVLLRLVGKSPL